MWGVVIFTPEVTKMRKNIKTPVLLAAVALAISAVSCSSQTAPGGSNTGATSTADTCKDFPVPIYPSTTKTYCEISAGHPTAYVDTNDSVQQVTKYYETLDGWHVKPDDSGVNSATHAVVVIEKSPGYASIV